VADVEGLDVTRDLLALPSQLQTSRIGVGPAPSALTEVDAAAIHFRSPTGARLSAHESASLALPVMDAVHAVPPPPKRARDCCTLFVILCAPLVITSATASESACAVASPTASLTAVALPILSLPYLNAVPFLYVVVPTFVKSNDNAQTKFGAWTDAAHTSLCGMWVCVCVVARAVITGIVAPLWFFLASSLAKALCLRLVGNHPGEAVLAVTRSHRG